MKPLLQDARAYGAMICIRAGFRVVEVPVLKEPDVFFGRQQIMTRRHLINAVVKRAHLITLAMRFGGSCFRLFP